MRKSKKSLLDIPIFSILHLNLEVMLYILLGVAAVAACFYNLGARTMSHDESLHALYSWKLYAGDGYEHNPMMHGPFLFHINALFYFLFGTSDFTARMSAAVFGVILVLLPALLRKELGRTGALVVSALTLISPSALYHARYIRNDIYMLVWALLMTIAFFRYLDTRHSRWIYLGAFAVTMALCTKETAYITGFINVTFVAVLYVRSVLSRRRARDIYVVMALILILLLIALPFLESWAKSLSAAEAGAERSPSKTVRHVAEVVILLIGILLSMLIGSSLLRRDERLRTPLKLMIAYVVAIVTLILAAAILGLVLWAAVAHLPEGLVSPQVFMALQAMAAGLGVAVGSYLWWLLFEMAHDKKWLPDGFQDNVVYITLGVTAIPFVLLYTTFFTNVKGLGTGTFGAISYWLAQQEVKRAGQPWYYYMIIAPLYDFVPIGFGLLATAYYLITGKVNHPTHEARKATRDEEPPSLPVVPYLIYWTISAWLIYSWAGEKMPWMMVHVVQPMILLTGRFADDLLATVDWPEVWRKGGAVLALLSPPILYSLGLVILLPIFGNAFRGMSLGDLNDTSKWLAALIVGGAMAYIAYRIATRLGGAVTRRVLFATFLFVGSLFTIRYAWMACYINYDTAREFLVYAHSTPDVKQTVREIKAISRRLYGDEHSIKFAYTTDATWPFEWYFETNFPNRVFIGREPTRENTDVPVLVVGRDEIAKVEPFLGRRYYRFDRKLIWWPHQDYYMGLSLAIPPEDRRQPGRNYFLLDMLDEKKRRAFLNVVFYRKYEQSLADWEPSHPFAFYVRKDVAAQMWDFGVLPGREEEGSGDPYARGAGALNTVAVLGQGMLNRPRNVAIGPDGTVYVLDTDNSRVLRFDADGQLITTWGNTCRMYEERAGCHSNDGAGEFFSPWGIAVDDDGFVYVADTWNHRVQKFDANGKFVTQWGIYGMFDAATGGEAKFWGPRAVAIGPDGLVYVSDTGNKRIQVFTREGEFVNQWGGKGMLDGQFDEPVGIAIATDGTTYVADTWNRRIQAFDANHFFLRKWEVYAWAGQSLDNKPYLALDARGRLYATDPEGYRVLVFDAAGRFLTALGRYGQDENSFALPTGIAVDKEGYIYVADTANNRVLKIAPLE